MEIEYVSSKSKISKNSISLASKKVEKFLRDQMNRFCSFEKINFQEFGTYLFNIGILSVGFNPKYDIYLKRNSSEIYDKFNNIKDQIDLDERKAKYILNALDKEVIVNRKL